MATNSLPPLYEDLHRSMNTSKYWQEQFRRRKTIDKEISEHVQRRRKLYDDLNDFLETKERVISITRIMSMRKRFSANVTDDDKSKLDLATPKLFIRPKQVEEAIEIALETSCRVHGSQEGVTKKEILQFVKKVFNLTEKQVDEAEEKSSQQPTKLQLICKVIKATGLKPKPGNAQQRNPFCRIGILNQKHYHPGSEFKTMSKWQKSGDVTEIATTTFKTSTLEPVWNEDIQLAFVGNVEEDVVVVEVWDQPSEEAAKKKLKNKLLKGLTPPDKEDFLGWMFHPLILVPIAGTELKVTLMSKGKKPLNGFITLFLSIQADIDNKLLETRLDEHHLLTRALINELSRTEDGGRDPDWNGELCSYSEKLLKYHGAMNRLNKLHMACIRFSELWKYHQFSAVVNMKTFTGVIKRVKKFQFLFPLTLSSGASPDVDSLLDSPLSSLHSSPSLSLSLTRRSLEPELDTRWVDQLFSELQMLESELMTTMNDHIRLVNFEFDGDLEKLNPYLSALLELYTFKAYVNQMNPPKELGRLLEKCIEMSVDSWFSLLKRTVMPTGGTEPRELRDLCIYILSWSERVLNELNLHPTFTQAGIDYFTLYIMFLDEKLSEEVQKVLKDYRRKRPDTITFEIYTTFQQLVQLSENAQKDIHLKLNILNFHKWFHGFVPGWINVATEKCESHIRQAIELDEIVKITEELKLSSSAVDTNGFLLQMATFWHHLDWPMAFEAYAYVISLVEKICNCANLYIGELFASLSPEDLRDDQGRFKASERLCLVLNNMFHVREHLTELPEHMKLKELYSWLREEDLKRYLLVEDGGPKVSEMDTDPLMSFDVKARNLLTELHSNADEDIMKKISDVVKKVCQNILPDIQTLIYVIVNSNPTDNEDMIIAPLFDYLTQNLIILGGNLLPPAFGSITTTLWEVTVEAIDQITELSRQKSQHVRLRLFNTLKALREFYYCDGAGVNGTALDTQAYFCLVSKLGILAMTTDQLILRFYYDLMTCQQEETRGERKFELVVSVGYIKEKSTVEVTVIHGENMELIHEPYIKLRLSSACKASYKHWKTKPVKGMQKAPLFNEDIQLPVPEEEMNFEGSLVLFYLLDKRLKSRIPFGVCAISCKKIPRLSASSKSSLIDPTAPQRKTFRLPMFRFNTETPALAELMERANNFRDGMAVNFLKVNQLLLSHIPHSPNYQPLKDKIGSMIYGKLELMLRRNSTTS